MDHAGDSLIINAPITGTGGVEQQVSGPLSLFGNNSFASFESTGGQATNYNNVHSFGPARFILPVVAARGWSTPARLVL